MLTFHLIIILELITVTEGSNLQLHSRRVLDDE